MVTSDIALSEIRSRIAAVRGANDHYAPVPHLGSVAEFDAFGDTYQAAIEQRDRTGGTTPAPGAAAAGTLPFDRTFGSVARLQAMPGIDSSRLSAAVNGQVAAPGARQVGGYGSMPVPPDLQAYGNGKVPAEALAQISQGNHRLYAPAAAAWDGLVAAAKADGIDLRITDSYRSYDNQVDLARRKGLYSEGGLAARPGTSNHGWGLAVDADVTNARTREWMVQNAPRFGWVEAVPREPWHWEFRPNQV